jgi:hypothetical protein
MQPDGTRNLIQFADGNFHQYHTHALESNRLALLYTRAVAETFVLRWGPAAELIIYYTNCSAWRWRAKKIHLRVCLCMLARE